MRQHLSPIKLKINKGSRVTVLCVGSVLRGDDAAGLLVKKYLSSIIKRSRLAKRIQLIAGETAPENFTGEIRRFRPDCVILVDSADTGKKPGEITLIPAEKAEGISFCTHKLPIRILTDYLEFSLKCRVMIVGIQPKIIKFGEPVSARVKKASRAAADMIAFALQGEKIVRR